MQNIKYILGLAVLLAASCTAPLTDDQKQADSVLLKQTHEYTLNADGSTDYRYFHKRVFNSYQAFHRYYGETFVVYNPKQQTLTVSKSETTMADGRKVNSPSNAFNEVLPFEAADAPAYNHLREMVITHVGLEIGAVVELDYTLHTQPNYMPVFASSMVLNQSSPVKELEVIVRVPKGQELKHSLANASANVEIKKSTKGNFDIYTWKATNLPARSNEPHQVEGMADYQTLTFSTTDLKGVFELLASKLTMGLEKHKSMESILQSKTKDWELVEEVRSYVAESMNTYRVSPSVAAFSYRTPNEVWQSNGGTEGEKAILLAELLKQLGFDAQLALAAYPHNLSKEVGCPSAFDKYLVRVNFNNEVKYLKATPDHTPIPGSRVTISQTDNIDNVSIEPVAKTDQKVNVDANLIVNPVGEITGNVSMQIAEYDPDKGQVAGIAKTAYTAKEETSEEGIKTLTLELGKGFSAEKVDGYLFVALPQAAQGIALARIGELPTTRQTRYELPFAIDEAYKFSIKIPKGITIVSPDYNEVVENEFGKVSVSFTRSGDEVTVSRAIVLNSSIVPVEAYNSFRSLVSVWMDKNMNRLVLKAE